VIHELDERAAWAILIGQDADTVTLALSISRAELVRNRRFLEQLVAVARATEIQDDE
jgi:hypothetical protein